MNDNYDTMGFGMNRAYGCLWRYSDLADFQWTLVPTYASAPNSGSSVIDAPSRYAMHSGDGPLPQA